MEQRKRVYRTNRGFRRLGCALLLAAAAVIVISGVLSRSDGNGFVLSSIPEPTAVPMDEAFDETPAETVLELSETNWYALQVGVFENEESARELAKAFQKRGAAGYLWQDGRYRVLAAAYPEREDAQLVREQLRDEHNIDSYLFTIRFPAVRLRLSGMQGQIDILKAAFVHASDLAVQIQKLSVSMDRQEMSVSETVSALLSLCEQPETVALRLKQRFASPVPSAVEALISCFDSFSAFANSVSAEESAASMGMQLKQQLFETLDAIQQIYQLLHHT